MPTLRTLLACLTLPMFLACGGGGGGSTPPTPALTYPPDGAALGGTPTITWVSPENPGTMDIALSNDAGATYAIQVAAGAPDNGMFSWDTTGLPDGSTYRLLLTPTNNQSQVGAPFGNAANFSIDNTAPVITLISPQAGDVFGGSAAKVTWTTTDANPGTVEIRLSSNSGATFGTVLAAAAPDTGVFVFDARGIAEGTSYRIRVRATDRAGNVGLPDSSAGDAEVDNTPPTVTLSSPVGGELWASRQNIVYSMSDPNPDHVELFLSADSGATYPESLTLTANPTGPYLWNTAVYPDGTTYRVRVVGVDRAGNRSLPADSPADFALENIVLKQNAYFTDEDRNGSLNAGDKIFLAFNEEIVFNSPSEVDFQMYVTGDSLGTGGVFTDENLVGEMSIALGTGASFRARGTFDPTVLTSGSPAGIDVADSITPDAIENTNGTDVAPIGGVDIETGYVIARTETGSDQSLCCAAGDIDGDGDVDFVIGRNAGLGIAIRTRNGLGEYPLSGFSPLGTDTVHGIALGDLDGDGDLDIATGNAGPNRIYFNNGNGSFVDAGQLLGSAVTLSVALGDLDGDGDLDMVCGNDFASPGRTYTNNGSGVFTQTGNNLGGFNSKDLALGDVDGDGDLDVLVGNQGFGDNRIWKNDGAGNFTIGSSVLTTQTARVALGDLDGDGDLDAVIGVTGQNEVSFNDGFGNFSASAQLFSNGDHRGLALVDFDEDGDLDALLTKYTDRDELWLNDGTGHFASRMSQNIGNSSSVDVAVGDFDRDGDLDYFAPGGLANDDVVWASSVSGVFGSTTLVLGSAIDADSGTTSGMVRGDVNRDGRLDLVAARSGGLAVLLGQGDGTFAAPASLAGSTNNSSSLALVDVDSDGALDLVQADQATGLKLYMGNGVGGFTLSANAFGGTVARGFALGDIDHDGDVDLVAGLLAGDDPIFLGNGDGTFTLSMDVIAGLATKSITLADLDGDGNLDAFLGTTSGARIALGDGAGAFTLQGSTFGADDITVVSVADVDFDGDLDAVVGTAGSGGRPFLNDGSASFTPGALFGAGLVRAVDLVDKNHDGKLEVILGVESGGNSGVYINNGSGDFTTTGQSFGATGVRSQVLADFDRDGDLDLIQGRISTTDVIWQMQ
ncbi:MAG: VCBS repeat-containing protein [Planctomycetes bacterium]|nr:VCBS repeat-containing protein [Planctomycetota bacterium]MCB9910634.1 VCBS repeat-containing protein [Planctomycetota bacterium]HPF13363.1 FG-GAP-like repeat-containing protein [Planctomycetota bacterium]